MKRGMAKVGVVLLNLGGPERIQDVGPFLYNLFADPEIIRLPNPALQKPLAWLISSLRAGKSQAAYRSIGGGSPLRRITEQQARELQSTLRQRGIEATSYVAMRYWHPFTESAVADIKADGIDEVVVLPLYPHFSISTSGSSFRELQRLRQGDPAFSKLPIRCIRSYYNDPGYIGAMAELIGKEIQACPDPAAAHVFFSAHGVPKSYVEEAGDPYQQEIETCAQLIMDKLASDLGHANPFTLAYQSRVGPYIFVRLQENPLCTKNNREDKLLLKMENSFSVSKGRGKSRLGRQNDQGRMKKDNQRRRKATTTSRNKKV